MAIWSPETGIVDWAVVTQSYVSNFEKSKGDVFLNFEVVKFKLANEDCDYPVMVFDSKGKVMIHRFF